MDVKNKNIVITGGSSGLGKAVAIELLSKSSNIFIIDISEKYLNEIKNEYSNIEVFKCDISNPHEVKKTIDEIILKANKIDILINSAGIMHSEPVVSLVGGAMKTHDFKKWEKVISTNLSGCFYVTASIVKNMMSHRIKGLIINFSSISAKGNAGQSAYAASKAGVEALTKSWAKELSFLGIRSVAIAPGFIDTESTRNAISENQIKNLIKMSPNKRLGKTEEVVCAINMIIENDFFNGKILELDGGLIF